MIKGIVKGFVAAGLGLALTTSVVEAQKPGVELGVQLIGLSMMNPDGDDNNITAWNIGGATFGGVGVGSSSGVTAAFYMTEMIAIEPGLGWGSAKAEASDDAVSIMSLNVAVPIYLARGWGKAGGFFIAPHIGMNRFDGGPGDAVSQNHFGASVGTKMEISDNLFWRVQAGVDMGMENEDDGLPSYTNIGASFGLSVYLR
jgi:hypothetical protein